VFIGLDANAAAMAESSRRAARAVAKGGLPNVLFGIANAEDPPAELRAIADDVTVLLPWGSLLRGVLAVDEGAAAGIAALLRPGGVVRALVSVGGRDAATTGLEPLTAADAGRIAARWRRHDLDLVELRRAESAEIADSGSTWARRLLRGAQTPEREIWRLVLRRGDDEGHPPAR
jgi:16S rRNA (adenine(1408)-N(1))-methyltransferase